MLWKEMFATTSGLNVGLLGRIAIGILCACAVVPQVFVFYYQVVSPPPGTWRRSNELIAYTHGCGDVLECLALFDIAIRAAGAITAEKERDTWLTLTSTPLTASEIVWAKILGSIYGARWFLAPVGFIWLLTTLTALDAIFVIPVVAGVLLMHRTLDEQHRCMVFFEVSYHDPRDGGRGGAGRVPGWRISAVLHTTFHRWHRR